MALADLADLSDRLGRDLTPTEVWRAPSLLEDASAKVKSHTRQSFAAVDDDEIVLRPVGTKLRLPQRPVREVSSVHAVSGVDGVPDLPLSGWTFDGIDLVDIAGLDSDVWVSLPAWWEDLGARPNTYRVVCSHGSVSEPVPPEVKAVVVSMVLRTLTSPSMAEGMVSERVGQYNYQLQQSAGSSGATVRLTQADKDALADAGWRRRATTVQVSV